MRIRLSQLRRLILEVVEEAMEEQDLDEQDSGRSTSGAGGTTHGDSWEAPRSRDQQYKDYLHDKEDAKREKVDSTMSDDRKDSMMMSGN